jgi:hypothetical protein
MPSTNFEATDIEIKYTKIFINNEWHKAENGKTFPVINPSTGEEICQVEEASRVQIHISFYLCNSSEDLFLIDRC